MYATENLLYYVLNGSSSMIIPMFHTIPNQLMVIPNSLRTCYEIYWVQERYSLVGISEIPRQVGINFKTGRNKFQDR